MDMQERVARAIAQVRAARRRWKPGELWKGDAGPRCAARTRNGTRCTRAAFVNGYCAKHGGGPAMATPRGRKR